MITIVNTTKHSEMFYQGEEGKGRERRDGGTTKTAGLIRLTGDELPQRLTMEFNILWPLACHRRKSETGFQVALHQHDYRMHYIPSGTSVQRKYGDARCSRSLVIVSTLHAGHDNAVKVDGKPRMESRFIDQLWMTR